MATKILSSTLRKEIAPCTLQCRARLSRDLTRCSLSSVSTSSPSSASPSTPSVPWFMDPAEEVQSSTHSSYTRRFAVPQAQSRPLPSLPSALPAAHPIVRLHAELKSSPHLEPGTLLVREPIPTATGPSLPDTMPRGRRKRGRTYVGEGVSEETNGIWEWLVIAQVKEGTENRGAIESVMRVVRKTLLAGNPPVALPHNNKRREHSGWLMVDAGDFAVHIVSKTAREKYFPERRDWAVYLQ